ncbi:Pkinase-domain-containing protein [Hysterangium stoloniferum]|nr:Pkinase-domain-containing protein [Hysterangium stoloniferum]
MLIDTPPSVPSANRRHPTRWEREKATASDPSAFEKPNDPKRIGPWILGETIGKGASRVKIARHKVTKKLAAVKILPFASAYLGVSPAKAQKHRMSVEREIVMMKLMEHPNIMRLYDVWEGRGNLYLVLEWIKGGELFDFLVERGNFHPAEALAYFKQIIYGLSYCHAFSIAHRDLKPENILIHGSRNELVKIADWGMAAFQTPFTRLETSCGSPHYASPEVIRGEHYEGAKADIWSVGVVLFALLAGKLPFDDEDFSVLLSKVKVGVFEMPSHVHPEAADLIKRMLVVDVRARISMYDILKHPFLRYDTPGIYYVAPPSLTTLQAPILSATDIDQDIFSSLCIIFGKHVSAARIQHDLLLDSPNAAKAFYVLLLKFRERQLRNHIEDSARTDREPGLYPYEDTPKSTPETAQPSTKTAPNAPAIPSAAQFSDRLPPPPALSRPSSRRRGTAPIDLNSALPSMSRAQASLGAARKKPRRRETAPVIPVSGLGLVAPAPAPIADSAENVLFPMRRKDVACLVLGDPTTNVLPMHRISMAEDRTPSSTFRPTHAQGKTVSYHISGHGKENVPDKPEPPVRRRRSSEGPKRIPGFFKTPVFSSGYDACRHTGVEENEKVITKEMRRDVAAVKSMVKRTIIRKNRRKWFFFAHSAASTPLVFSPVVQEFRGWFSNLFHWKTPTCILHSPLDCSTTRDETTKLLTEFGVLVTLEDTLDWGVLKCRLEEKFDAGGSLIQKQVRFRVEFQSRRVSLLVSPAIDGPCPPTPQPGLKLASSITLIQERGALSTFRNICQRLRTEWKFVCLSSYVYYKF